MLLKTHSTSDACSLSCLDDSTLSLFIGIFFSSCSVKVLLCRNTFICTIVFIFFKKLLFIFFWCAHSARGDQMINCRSCFFSSTMWTPGTELRSSGLAAVFRFGISHNWTIKYWGGWFILSNIMFVRFIHLFTVAHRYYHIWFHCSIMLQFCCFVFETVSLHSPDYSRTK